MITDSVFDMDTVVAVDAPPTSDWSGPRPEGLAPQLWAESRPTRKALARLSLPYGGDAIYGPEGQLLGWESGSRFGLGDLWLSCARQFPSTGLWPLCDSEPLSAERWWQNLRTEDGRPYWRDPYAVPTDVYDAVHVADRRGYFQDDDNDPNFFRALMEDFGLRETDMKLAAAKPLPDDPLGRLVAPDTPDRLTLVACRRPADAVLLLDFGVANDVATPGIFTGVLRSWETRFGVVPVRLTQAWTAFQVIAPPTDQTQIDRLAAEIFSFATDSACQGGFHVRTEEQSVKAQEMAQSREWLIWWD